MDRIRSHQEIEAFREEGRVAARGRIEHCRKLAKRDKAVAEALAWAESLYDKGAYWTAFSALDDEAIEQRRVPPHD